ncbi:MAG: arylesterase [Acidobacteria bacterium]|nr:arylesterase [Acidobacteriota bacterium]
MRSRAWILMWGLVAACGRPPVEQPERVEARSPAPKMPAAPDPRPVVAAFGDSLSAGFGANPGASYPDFLQRELDRRRLRYRVANLGVSGDTTTGGVARVDSVLALQPKLVILELGGNDGLRGLPVSATRSNLEQMIEVFERSSITVVLAGITLPPNYGADYVGGFDQMYRELAAHYKLPLIPFLLEGVATVPGLMQPDGIHPTAEGNRKVAQTVMRTIEPLLTAR